MRADDLCVAASGQWTTPLGHQRQRRNGKKNPKKTNPRNGPRFKKKLWCLFTKLGTTFFFFNQSVDFAVFFSFGCHGSFRVEQVITKVIHLEPLLTFVWMVWILFLFFLFVFFSLSADNKNRTRTRRQRLAFPVLFIFLMNFVPFHLIEDSSVYWKKNDWIQTKNGNAAHQSKKENWWNNGKKLKDEAPFSISSGISATARNRGIGGGPETFFFIIIIIILPPRASSVGVFDFFYEAIHQVHLSEIINGAISFCFGSERKRKTPTICYYYYNFF